ncbi:substrate-binding periplasmic protein [Azospirillum canadense]|uniref:substrate-binding periplasmic protein n=1 Tax=Azospirillum canadense TaxID=403962 RepID=UPI0022280448|nr:transporter substrate-binding domain-containing protein [Azospirillum canadense]MCW2237306.1 polar amino acid transport system substrate-binding protein [Azospirillum canadense]
MIGTVLRGARRALAAGVFGVVFGFGISGAAAQAVKLGYVEFPPYTRTDGGTAKGSLVEAFDKAAKAAGIAYTAESAPARRLFSGIADGEFHVFLGIKSVKEFEGTTLVSAAPIARIELNAYGVGDAPAVKAKEDLSGKAVIALNGYSYGGWRAWMDDPTNKVQIVEARTADQALQLLQAGRAPVLLQYSLPMQQALGGKAAPELKAAPVQALDVYVVVSKKAPDAEALLARLESGFKATQ